MLDGVNITDPVTGTFSLNFNYDAIEQIEVLTSAFDPEYGYNLGGSINVITRSGGNTLEVNTGIFYTNGNWAPTRRTVCRGRCPPRADGFRLAVRVASGRCDRVRTDHPRPRLVRGVVSVHPLTHLKRRDRPAARL